jgi:hypothetical protein
MKFGEIINCPRCNRELLINEENYMLGEEAFTDGKYSVWMDCKITENFDFICRICVLEEVMRVCIFELEKLTCGN